MKRQNSIFNCTLQCIFAVVCSGLFFNLIMILIVMLVSDGVGAETPNPVMNIDIAITQAADANPRKVKQGSLLFKSDQGFTQAATLDTDVHIQIAGMIARATVKQKFHNDGTDWKEGIYTNSN